MENQNELNTLENQKELNPLIEGGILIIICILIAIAVGTYVIHNSNKKQEEEKSQLMQMIALQRNEVNEWRRNGEDPQRIEEMEGHLTIIENKMKNLANRSSK